MRITEQNDISWAQNVRSMFHLLEWDGHFSSPVTGSRGKPLCAKERPIAGISLELKTNVKHLEWRQLITS